MQNVRSEEILKDFAEKVRSNRKNKGLTQEELAELSGLSLSQIARIETAKLNSTICTVVVLARSMKISPSKLLDI